VSSNSELIKEVESFSDILIKTATNGYDQRAFKAARDIYTQSRIDILSNDELRTKMPSFIISCRTLDDFSGFIKEKGNTVERRTYLKNELSPVSAFIYGVLANSNEEGISKTRSVIEIKRNNFQKSYDKGGSRVEDHKEENGLSKSKNQKPRIFIIHGHDTASIAQLKVAIFKIGGHPMSFDDLPKEGSQTIIEILENHIPNFNAIIALLTPDDEGRKRGEETLELRARQNVLIEAGYGIISQREKSLLIALGDVSIPSDFDGIHRVAASNWSPEVGLNVA
jgi:hypothetical protein